MLKAIQILGSSSGFVSYRFRKPQPNTGFSLISIPSRKPIVTTSETLLLPASQVHTHKCCFRDFRMSSTHSKSGASSSSVAIQSTVSCCYNCCLSDLCTSFHSFWFTETDVSNCLIVWFMVPFCLTWLIVLFMWGCILEHWIGVKVLLKIP